MLHGLCRVLLQVCVAKVPAYFVLYATHEAQIYVLIVYSFCDVIYQMDTTDPATGTWKWYLSLISIGDILTTVMHLFIH